MNPLLTFSTGNVHWATSDYPGGCIQLMALVSVFNLRCRHIT